MADFKQTLENCRVVAFDSYVNKDGKKSYKLGVLQGREHCEMLSCDENVANSFDCKTMFDKLCRLVIRNVSLPNGSWTVVTGIDFIKSLESK